MGGYTSDSSQFVMPYDVADNVAALANGDSTVFDTALGFEPGHFSSGVVRVDVLLPENIRFPSGNESGANLWMSILK